MDIQDIIKFAVDKNFLAKNVYLEEGQPRLRGRCPWERGDCDEKVAPNDYEQIAAQWEAWGFDSAPFGPASRHGFLRGLVLAYKERDRLVQEIIQEVAAET